jgi:hypothetical protein
MKLCPRHLDKLREALLKLGHDPRKDLEPLHQAVTLINLNAIEHDVELMGAPAEVCPICHLFPRSKTWIKASADSIAHDRKAPQ